MAKNFHTDNKAFMLYKDWEDIFQALDSSEEIGELVMALFAYAKRGETPKLSGGVKIAFLMMRAAIERDGIAWEEMCAQRSECGKRVADLKSLMSQGILMKKLSRQLHQQIMQKKNLRV